MFSGQPNDGMLLSLQQQQDSIRPANSASQSLLLTPKHVGEAMSAGDPYYRPNCKAHNPFATLKRFKVHPQFLFSIICATAMNVIDFFFSGFKINRMDEKYWIQPVGDCFLVVVNWHGL